MHQTYFSEIQNRQETLLRKRQPKSEASVVISHPGRQVGVTVESPENTAADKRRWRSLKCLFPLFVPLILLLLIYRSSAYEPRSFELEPSRNLTGALLVNNILSKATHLVANEVYGPEAMLVHGDALIVSNADGRLLKVVRNSVTTSMRLNEEIDCRDEEDRPRCGLPLSIRPLSNGLLLVLDAYHGVYRVDINNKTSELILSVGESSMNGEPIRNLYDMVVRNDDEILLSEPSTKWLHHQKHAIRMEHSPNGRILRFFLREKRLSVLVSGLQEPRGIELLPDREHLLIAETGNARILQLSLSTGRLTTWAGRLPGLPSGIRLSIDKRHIWAAFDETRVDTTSHALVPIAERFSSQPFMRKALLWLLPQSIFRRYYHYFSPRQAIAVKFELDGSAAISLHAPGGLRQRGSCAQVHETPDVIYVVAAHLDHILRIDRYLVPEHVI